MAPIITVEHLSKRYWVGQDSTRRESYTALRDVLARQALFMIRKAMTAFSNRKNEQPGNVEEFLALRDVSFEIQAGEVVGIVGRNGAGKSTLLKVLSRITEPSAGRITLRGRVASLLEVGTGFHPELTGRENIYLNGAILGMHRAEIKRKFDEIVDFAEVEKFLDTPVKRYSSGMYVRLAFAVAAHLEPEILVVDEVLAVGDADFQKKCLGKMRDVGASGRTVLLVSHNMGSIASLCKRAILLQAGSVVADGPASDVILSHLGSSASRERNPRTLGNENGSLIDVWTEDFEGNRSSSFSMDSPIRIVMDYRIHRHLPVAPYVNFHIFDERGQYAFVAANRLDAAKVPGSYRAVCEIPANLLNDGAYFIGAALTCSHNGIEVCFFDRDAVSIHVVESLSEDVYGPPRFGFVGPMPGVVRPVLSWTISDLHATTTIPSNR